MRPIIILQVVLVLIAFFITGWIFFKERPQAVANQHLQQELSQVKQENQQLQQLAETPTADERRRAQAYLRQGRELLHNQRYDEATKKYAEALKLQPDDGYGWGLQGYALLRAGRIAESVDANKKSIQLDPEDPYGYLNLAKSYCADKQYAEAQRVLLSEPPTEIKSDVKQLIVVDGEVRRLCKPIIANLGGGIKG